jgi:hypothetical protein
MTTSKQHATPKPHEATDVPENGASRRQKIVGWAEFGVDAAASAQKQWNDIAFAYADLGLKAFRDGLSWVESYYEQSRKTLAKLAEARDERARAILERLS